tara:strand:- start:347 stop:1147 length:801 start_codon:yes stop_codon:yes gene_type:complete
MKLSFSNIALKRNFDYLLNFLVKHDCAGVELAPDLVISEPTKTTLVQRKEILSKIKKKKLTVTGLHSLLFEKNECQLFSDKTSRTNLINYLKNIMIFCADLEGNQVVYGSPKSRKLFNFNYKEATNISLDVFNELSEFGKKINVYFCVEPLDKIECDFLNTYNEAIELAKKVNSDYFKINFDTKTFFYSKENLKTFDKDFEFFQHFQISDENLKPIYLTENNHSEINYFLRRNKYDNFISIEMVDTGNEKDLVNSINFVKNTYDLK